MPGRSARPCTYPGCKTLVRDGTSRCPEHRASWPKRGPQSTSDRGYGWTWQKLRTRILKRDNYLCQISLAQGWIVPATEVDHVVPKFEGGTDDPSNLQAVCHDEHEKKSRAEAERARGG